MESGSIPDSKITASSVQSVSTPASNSRLNFASGSSWCSVTSDANPYLQIDLQTLHIICAVSTQGNSQADQWVRNYTLQSSKDGSTWTDYTEIGQVKSLKGNEDRNSSVKHILNEGVLARYLRFLPETYHGGVCLRTEVFGVEQKPENLALGKPTAQSSTYSNALIGYAGPERAVDGSTDNDMRTRHCTHTKKDNPSWWRVDLGSDHVPVSEIHIINRFTGDPGNNNIDYKITFGNSTNVENNLECVGRYSFIQFKASAVCFTNPLTTGRYVGIMTIKSQILQLCEVEIYSRENLAFGRQTDQISTAHYGLSRLGADGNSDTNYSKGSCTHTNVANKPWWRVDLGQVESVSEVYIVNRGDGWTHRLDNFEIRVGSMTSGGGVANPTCGGTYSVPGGKGLSFFCRPPLYGRYVTIRSLRNDALTLCEVEVYSERRACQIQALGVSSKDAFPDSSFSASSISGSNVASKGRLNGVGAWSPSNNNNPDDYLQINLKYEFFICAVATQGKSTDDHWSTKYKLHLSLNNVDWTIYKENGTDKVFHGNSGRNDTVKHNLKEIARARFIRFQPTTYSARKALRVEVFGILKPAAPSQAPGSFVVSPLSSTSVKASWLLPPAGSRHGAITGFKLLYQKKNSPADYPTILTIESNSTLSREVAGLLKYTKYEFQVLAFSYVGNGPKSSVEQVTTKQDAPSAPVSLGHTHIMPSRSHGPRIVLTWSKPAEPNGVVRSYTVFYSRDGNTRKEIPGIDALSYTVDVLGGFQYQFHVRAVTIKPGPNATLTVDIPAYSKPFIKDLPERTILAVGELAILTCEVSGDPEPSVTWSKNGGTNVPRAQLKNDGRILAIKDVLPIDSGVYECKASNKLGESRSSTTVIVAVPPSIIEDVSSSSVICEMQTLCSFSCHATSDSPFNYSWTKNGQVPVSDNIKIMNNIIVLTPRDAKDYGVYVCHATNSFGSTDYKVTLSEGRKSSTWADTRSTSNTTVITFSCTVFVLLVVIGLLIWRLRRALPNNRATTADKAISDCVGQPDSPRDQQVSGPGSCMELHPRSSEGQSRAPSEYKALQRTNSNPEYYNMGFSKQGSGRKLGSPYDQRVSEPGAYMELHPRPSEGQSHAFPEYESLQGKDKNPGYYNVGFNKGNKRDEQEEIYDEIGNAPC